MNTPSTFLHGMHVRANGIRQHVLRFGGRGAALIVVPGIMTPAALWTDVGNRLGAAFDTFVVDVRGRGLSESGDHLDYGAGACAADLCDLVGTLRLTGVTVLGHSFGARVALRAALRCKAAFGHVILADPPVSGPGRRPYPIPLEPMLALLDAARQGRAWESLASYPSAPWPEHLARLRAEWLHTCDPRAATVTYRGFHEDDFHGDLAALEVPATLIAAGKGGVIQDGDLLEIQHLNSSVTITRLMDAGHQMQVDDFEGFLAAVGRACGQSL